MNIKSILMGVKAALRLSAVRCSSQLQGNDIIGKHALICNIHDGFGYNENDNRYIGKAFMQGVRILHKTDRNLFITDFFLPEYQDLNNDYIYYGFLLVTRENIKICE